MSCCPVSVVIPTYNCGRYVAEAVQSAFAQTIRPLEIIIVDDGSTDDTQGRLQPYMGEIVYRFQRKSGVSAARNLGIELARGDYVAFLDADDVWHPRKLEYQMRAFSSHPDLGVLGTTVCNWPATEFPQIDEMAEGSLTIVPWRKLVVRNYLATSSVLVRRSILVQAGEFDCRMAVAEDRDVWLRLAEIAPVANLNIPLVGYRVVPGSASRQADRAHESMLLLLQKLDERDAWRGDRLLRRKAYSYVFFTSAINFRGDGWSAKALVMAMRSLTWYPWPYRREEVIMPWARPKTLLVNAFRSICSKKPAIA